MQVLTGKSPFNYATVHECIHAIIEGVRPEKPKDAEAIGLSAALWELVQACWSEDRTRRPRIRVIVDIVRDAAARWNTPMPHPIHMMARVRSPHNQMRRLVSVMLW
jgi:hypothetical protein